MDITKMYPNCRTCLVEIQDNSFHALRDDPKSIAIKNELCTCVPELVVELVIDPVMCSQCIGMLHIAYEFKRKCVETEEHIKSYIHKHEPSFEKKDAVTVNLANTSVFETKRGESSAPEAKKGTPPPKARRTVLAGPKTRRRSFGFNRKKGKSPASKAKDVVEATESDAPVVKATKSDATVVKATTVTLPMAEPNQIEAPVEMEKKRQYRKRKSSAVVAPVSEPMFAVDLLDDLNHLLDEALENSPISQITHESPLDLTKGKPADNVTELNEPGQAKGAGIERSDSQSDGSQDFVPKKRRKRRKMETVFCCTFCNYKSAYKGNLKKHACVHANEKPYSCLKCEFRCGTELRLRKHVEEGCVKVKKLKKEDTQYSCPLCPAKYVIYVSLVKHLSSIHDIHDSGATARARNQPKKPIPTAVSVPSETTASSSLAKTAVKSPANACPYCPRKLGNNGALVRHLAQHADTKKELTCRFCHEFSTESPNALFRHITAVHSGNFGQKERFACKLCDFVAFTRKQLKAHKDAHQMQQSAQGKSEELGNGKKEIVIEI